MDKTYRVLVSFESLTAGSVVIAEATERMEALRAAGYLEEVGFPPRGVAPAVITEQELDRIQEQFPDSDREGLKKMSKRIVAPKE